MKKITITKFIVGVIACVIGMVLYFLQDPAKHSSACFFVAYGTGLLVSHILQHDKDK